MGVWWKQAERDLKSAKNSFNSKDYYVSAPLSQQAAKKALKLVVSNDDTTMLSELSLKSYQIVNQILDLHSPKFRGYEDLKKKLLS